MATVLLLFSLSILFFYVGVTKSNFFFQINFIMKSLWAERSLRFEYTNLRIQAKEHCCSNSALSMINFIIIYFIGKDFLTTSVDGYAFAFLSTSIWFDCLMKKVQLGRWKCWYKYQVYFHKTQIYLFDQLPEKQLYKHFHIEFYFINFVSLICGKTNKLNTFK